MTQHSALDYEEIMVTDTFKALKDSWDAQASERNQQWIGLSNDQKLKWAYAQHQQLVREAEALRSALTPFAKLLQDHNKRGRDDQPIFGINDCTITLGQLRKAKAALALHQEQESKE